MSKIALKLIEKEKKVRTGKLDLALCGLTHIPYELFELKWLKELRLTDTMHFESVNNVEFNKFKLDKLPDEFSALSNLETLYLGGTQPIFQKEVNCDILSKTNISELIIGNITLSSISFVANLINLKTLHITNLSKRNYDYSIISKNTKLKDLRIIDYKLTDISFLKSLNNLQHLQLYSNMIKDFSAINNSKSLKTLKLGSSALTNWDFMNGLINIKELHLLGCKLNNLNFLDYVINLTTLELHYNKLKIFKVNKSLTNLTNLTIKNNELTSFSYKNSDEIESINLASNLIENCELVNLPKLKSIDLSENTVKIISTDKHSNLAFLNLSKNKNLDFSFISNIKSIQILNLNNNEIENLDFLEPLSALKEIFLNETGITDIQLIRNFKKLEVIEIKNNGITDISSLKDLSKLTKVIVSRNKISNIDSLVDLSRLELVDVSYNVIKEVKKFHFDELKSFNISNNRITKFDLVSSSKKIKELRLSSNSISELSIICESVDSLWLNGNQLKSSTKLPNNVNFLMLSNNNFTECNFLKTVNINKLYLDGNNIISCSELESHNEITMIDISNNPIKSIDFLKKLQENLKHVRLFNNPIESLAPIKQLTNLESLSLRSFNLENPEFLANLENLTSLDLSNTNLTSCSFVNNLKQLRRLHLDNNLLSKISISNLSELMELHAANNELVNIELENLSWLQAIYLKKNSISDLYIKNTPMLNVLHLYKNKIRNINFLADIVDNLSIISLDNNNIRDFSILYPWIHKTIEVKKTEKFSWLSLEINNNPGAPPVEIIAQGYDSILRWFKSNKKQLNEIKVSIVGEGNVGKTSLLNRIKLDKFSEDVPQTEGINIEEIKFGELQTFSHYSNLKDITGYFWDFGGQEILSSTHEFFLTKRTIYILVCDARKDGQLDSLITDWILKIKNYGNKSKVIVVINKFDNNPSYTLNKYELMKANPQIVDIIGVSSKTGENIEQLKELLSDVIPSTELFCTKIDERWIELKDYLRKETKQKNYLTTRDVHYICKTVCKINDIIDIKDAICFLNDLGIVLHFDDFHLEDYYIFDPEWITSGVYKIINSKFVSQNYGIIDIKKELSEIVNNEKEKNQDFYISNTMNEISYSNQELIFLLNVMAEFELGYFFNSKCNFLIPDLITNEIPIEAYEKIKNSADNLRLIYRFKFLDKAVIHRLLILMHNEVVHKWKTGFISKSSIHPYAESLVFSHNKQIEIYVIGNNKSKREYLTIIRYFIGLICNKLNKDVKIYVPLTGYDKTVEYTKLLKMENAGKTIYEDWTLGDDVIEFELCKLLENIEPAKNTKELSDKIINHIHINQTFINIDKYEAQKGSKQIISEKIENVNF